LLLGLRLLMLFKMLWLLLLLLLLPLLLCELNKGFSLLGLSPIVLPARQRVNAKVSLNVIHQPTLLVVTA